MTPATRDVSKITSSVPEKITTYPLSSSLNAAQHPLVYQPPYPPERAVPTIPGDSQSLPHGAAPPLPSSPIPVAQPTSHFNISTALHSTPVQPPVVNPLQDRDPNTSAPSSASRRLLRKPGPGLLARLKLLDTRTRRRIAAASQHPVEPENIGRIPESQLKELDDFHRDRQIVVERKGRPWFESTPPKKESSLPTSGTTPTQEVVGHSLDTQNLHLSSVMAALGHDERSDISSIISASDRAVLSESDESDEILDTQKYRLPDLGKLKGSSRNGFVMEDGRTIERDRAPTPPPKDSYFPPNGQNAFNSTEEFTGADRESYFNPYGLSRAGSIYTLSRASFSNQISQLTSVKLPQAASLSSSISAIPSSIVAAKALNDAADQIKLWIKKATEVLEGLDAEDDVEWAAAGGREGLGEVDVAINRFESLIDVYVGAIEELESRPDVDALSAQDLKSVVDRMERILGDWESIRKSLEGVKQQVEIAMEWEELWNSVLGEIGMEEENLSGHIFEMEERRHKNSLLDSLAEPGQGLDIKELETIVEEAPARKAAEIKQKDEDEEEESTQPAAPQLDSNLLSLFARMQPLRASLDFLPMRLSAFLNQARPIFPTACDELEVRMEQLESKYRKLESDAESLRKELGEDRWVLIFRKAGRQALKMCESVDRSVIKLRDALDEGIQHTNPAALTKRIENYEAKREHYGPAIKQVLAIVDRGVQTRLTVNGEILRLQADIQRRWADVEDQIKAMDFALEQLNIARTHQLRDSISTILSEQRSIASSTGTLLDTPGSSPASSVVLLSRQSSEHGASTPFSPKSRQDSFTSSTTTRAKRYSSLPVSNSSSTPRKTPLSKSSTSNLRVSGVSNRLYQPPPSRSVSRAESSNDTRPSKPRWNSSTSLKDTPIGHCFNPISDASPPPYHVHPGLRSQRSSSRLSSATSSAIPSPLGRSYHSAVISRPSSTVPPVTPQLLPPKNSTASHLTRPKLAASATTGILQPGLKTPASKAAFTGIPRASSAYMTPTPATPPLDASARRHLSRASVASSASSSATATTTLTDRTMIRMSSASIPTPQGTPSAPLDSAGSSASSSMRWMDATEVDQASPSSSRTTATATNATAGARSSRPTTALGGGNRRSSMLPQPKRAPSGMGSAAMAAAAAAMSGRTTPATAGRAGSRLSFGLGSGAGASGNIAKPKWR